MIAIIQYKHTYQKEFKELNLFWLNKYNLTESHDLMVLDDPSGTIIERGGFIFLAVSDGEVVGTAALVKEGEDEFELAKMSVSPSFQGQGISNQLIESCLNKAKELAVKKIVLFSNHQLTTAINLYTKYGFKQVEVTNSPFVTADVKMELYF